MRTTPTKLTRSALLAASLLALAGCIKRQPLPEPVPGEVAATDEKQVVAKKVAPSEPTGNWGKVQGVDLLSGRGHAALSLGGQEDKVALSQQAVSGEEFQTALRADTQRPSGKPWDVQLRTVIEQGVEQGDILLASFYVRAGSMPGRPSTDAETEFVFELGAAPYTKSVTQGVQAGPDWQKVYVPFKAEANYPPGTAQAAFRLGYKPQRLEIAAVKVENFGKELALADLPTTSVTYRGMAANAPWRAAAQERIARLRQGDLEVVVKEKGGKPAAGATIELELVRHAFQFGTSAPAERILEADSKFRQVLEENFNAVSLEPDLAWPVLSGQWGPEYTLERAQEAVDALRVRGLTVRSGPVVEPGWSGLPSALAEVADKPAALTPQVRSRIEDLLSAFKGKVSQWDVVSNPYDQHELLDVLGGRATADWFKWARAADPAAQLFLRESGLLVAKGMAPRRAAFDALLNELLAAGAPIDGLALEAVFGPSLTPPEVLLETLDRLALAKKPILITAFDVAGVPEDLRARYLEDFYTVMYSHPAVLGVILLGFWDGAHVRNDALLFGEDWSPKLGGEAFGRLVRETWSSSGTAEVDAAGSHKRRAFHGDYLVRAKTAQGEAEGRVTVGATGGRVVIQL